MPKKIKYLVIGAGIVISFLALIQLYFLRNTQKLYEKQSITEIKEVLANIEKEINMHSTRKDLCDNAVNLATTESNRSKLIVALQASYDSNLTHYIYQRINENDKLKKGRVHYNVKIVRLLVNFTNGSREPIILSNLKWIGKESYGNSIFLGKNNISGSSEKGVPNPVYVEYNTITTITIANLNNTIFKKLAGLIFFSIFLFGCVVWLFYQSIKNIVLQKKIADVKTDFVNNITHEFKTPLTTLDIATAALKKKGIALDDDSHEIIDTIERQSKRLNMLTKQAIEFSKSGAEILVDKKILYVGLLIKNIVTDFQKLHPCINININMTDKEKSILADAELLTTAINNILDNSMKYGGTKISIEVLFSNTNCVIAIKDSGMGMAKEKLKYIFDKFYRIETGNVHNTKGLGLGLYYASQVAKAHGGKIAVESTLGQGSVFTINIPVS